MTAHDRSPTWIGLADLLLCMLSVVIVAVAPNSRPSAGPEQKAEYLVSIDWDVDIDADADIWLISPSKRPVFYSSRAVGCATLDRDSRGFQDFVIALADGSQTKVKSNTETIALRCLEPGRYDFGIHLYAYRVNGADRRDTKPLELRVRFEVVGLNPTMRTLLSKSVTLDRVWQTINVASFDMDRSGRITFADPPLEPVTAAAYKERAQ